MGISFLLSMAATLILGNQMSPGEFGEFALLKNFVLIGSTFAIFGMDQAAVRNNINSEPAISLTIVNIVSFILSILFSLSMKVLFSLTVYNTIYLSGIIFCGSNVIYIAAVYRLKNHFLQAQFIHNSWKIILFIVVASTFILGASIQINFIYKALFFSMLIVILLHYFLDYLIIDKVEIKNNDIQGPAIRDGMILWVINVLGLVFAGMDRFIIPTITSSSVLGTYYAISFIYITAFTMIGSAVGYVIFPYLSKNDSINWKNPTKFILLILLLISAGLFFLGHPVTSILFHGKYDQALITPITTPILIMGIIQCFHTIVHFYIYAKSPKKLLVRYIVFLFMFCICYFFSFYIMEFLIQYSLRSLVFHITIIWVMKMVVGLIMVYLINNSSLAHEK
jgi:O-antigen/teichoic acid export membrane protein